MKYSHIRKKLGGKIKFLQGGGGLSEEEKRKIQLELLGYDNADAQMQQRLDIGYNPEHIDSMSTRSISIDTSNLGKGQAATITTKNDATENATGTRTLDPLTRKDESPEEGFSVNPAAVGAIAQVGIGAVKALDEGLMGNNNFGAQSEAIDSAVHGVSGALMATGNPYAMAAGAALEGVNFITKAGGETVQGFDVDIASSGYGNLGHMQSSSSRDWSFVDPAGFGQLFGISKNKKLQAKLNRRNEQAQMALTAAQISQDQKFEQEARTNNITNVLMNNQIALAGGVDTQALGS